MYLRFTYRTSPTIFVCYRVSETPLECEETILCPFISMEGSSFSEEFIDVIGDMMQNMEQPVQARSGKGMATFVYTEMIKQLEVLMC